MSRPQRNFLRLLGRLATTCLVAAASIASAQAPGVQARVAILPFDVDASVQAYQLGLSAALQHALNQIPGVYAPPVGDTALVANKAAGADQDALSVVGRLFDATAIVTGQVASGGGGVRAVLNVTVGGATTTIEAQGADPATLLEDAAVSVARLVRPDVGAAELEAVRAASRQTPSVPSLGPVGLAASGLPGARVDDLATATELDASSAWVHSEYARALALSGAFDQAVLAARRATELAPDDADVQATAGVVFEAAGQDEDAAGAFGRALASNPAHAVALAGRASLAGADSGAATSDLQAAIAAYPRFVDAYLRLAGRQTDAQRALQTARRAEAYAPESVLLRGSVMQRLVDAGDARGALAYLQQALEEPLARSAAMYALARRLPSSVADQALTLVRTGKEAYPESTELALAEADILLQSGNAAEAEAILGPLFTQNPSDASTGNLLAVAQARQGDIEAARRTFESLRGQGADVDRALAELYLAAGRAAAALPLLEPLASAAPDDADLQALYGTALVRMGRLEDGEAALRRALQLEPDQALATRSLALLDQQRQLTGEAEIVFGEEAGAAFQQGLYALDVEDYAAAAQAFARSREIEENALAAFYHGYARQLQGETRAAIADYEVALQAFPESDIVLNNLGYAQLELGRFDLALDYLRRAVASNPSNARAHLNLGLVRFATGQYDSAIASFEEAARLDPRLTSTTDQLITSARERSGQ